MTQAQKNAKAKFKQAIAYRTKTGVSLKEAFAHIYGKKKVVKKAIKKAAPKKKAVKKVAKKRIAGPKDSAMVKKELAKKGLKMPHGYATIKRKRKISGVKKKKITETGILNKIHIVKRNVDKLDEAQHKHMMGTIKPKSNIVLLSKKIARYTDLNDHNKSILTLAKFLNQKKAVIVMNHIIKMHEQFGSMPQQLITLRSNVLTQLMQIVKSKYGSVDYTLINKSF
jgi:hypothetical protein